MVMLWDAERAPVVAVLQSLFQATVLDPVPLADAVSPLAVLLT